MLALIRRSLGDLRRAMLPSWELLRWFASSVRRGSLEPRWPGPPPREEGGDS